MGRMSVQTVWRGTPASDQRTVLVAEHRRPFWASELHRDCRVRLGCASVASALSLYSSTASQGMAQCRPFDVTSIPRHGSPLRPCGRHLRSSPCASTCRPSRSFMLEEGFEVVLVVGLVTADSRCTRRRRYKRKSRHALGRIASALLCALSASKRSRSGNCSPRKSGRASP